MMRILALNGSPKGDYSIMLQTVRYIAKKHPEHSFQTLNVGAGIKRFERDFSEAKAALEQAEMILFSYPVYTFLVPGQLHRFVELMKASGLSFRGAYATQITTSKHFYDVTAHRFIQENAQDMGMKFIRGLSADMDDLLTEKGQADALHFFDYLLWCVENDVFEPLLQTRPAFVPQPVSPLADTAGKTGDVVIVADIAAEDTQLAAMVARFQAACSLRTRVVNIREFPFNGGCISCFHCAADGKCIYTDGFDTFLREQIQTAQAVVIACALRDHSMGSLFMIYDDCQFCNGHRTVTMGMPFGYLISRSYSTERNLQTVVEGRAEVGGTSLPAWPAMNTIPTARSTTSPNGCATRRSGIMYSPPTSSVWAA